MNLDFGILPPAASRARSLSMPLVPGWEVSGEKEKIANDAVDAIPNKISCITRHDE